MTETEQHGKGRPTPKRSEARAARKKPLVTPRGKTAAKTDRAERAELRRKMREAMRTGDERYYPPMAAGPERALVRDVVDARKSFGWFAIPGWLAGVLLTMIPTPVTQVGGTLVLFSIVIVLVADLWLTGRAVRRALDRRWPEGTETSRKSLVWYGIARNTQFRRQRLPRPRVERGQEVGQQ